MSWLARSIASTLKLEEDEDDDQIINHTNLTDSKSPPNPPSSSSPSSTATATTPRGVKEDLSELTKTLTKQFWGVASFLAPPPTHDPQISDDPPSSDNPSLTSYHPSSDPDDEDEDLIAGIRSDFAEIGGRFKSGISKLSSNVNVSEITKIASNFLQIGSEGDFNDEELIGSAVGVTEEVIAFARDIAMHPETWIDFPIPDHDDFDDFDMSDAQQEHALAVERLSPRLAALRLELCPGYMSEDCFWKIYFVLVHPRLRKHDAQLLSTAQVVEARAMLSHEWQNQAKPTKPGQSEIGSTILNETTNLQHEESLSVPSYPESESASLKTSGVDVNPSSVEAKTSGNEAASSVVADELEKEKHLIQSTEMQIIDKAVVGEERVYQAKYQNPSSSTSKVPNEKFEDDTDDWLKEESSEMVGTSGTTIHIENDEDVSFSDLEEDDGEVPISYKKVTSGSDASSKDSRDWVQLRESSADSVKDINPITVKHAGSEQVSARNSDSKESNDWLDVDDIDVM